MSDARRKPFPFDQFEPQWQQRWDEEKTFHTPNPGEPGFDSTKPKYYVLDMFPYPSGTGLHVGHPEGYTATDIIGRTKRRQGFNVLHPMGWDSFGLPAEQYAIKTGQHPRVTTEENIDNFRRQLKSLGFGYDWEREVATTDPGYVRWTQWIFLQLYHAYFDEETQRARPVSELEAKGWSREQIDDVRLAYIHEAPVNWSPDLGTVLANEEVEEWKAKGHTVERKPLRQWMLRITKYAQRLIDELEPLDWPEGIKLLQKNWIGRSEGAEVHFQIDGADLRLEVFTTRPDTLFGATYMVLAPEHPYVEQITTDGQKEPVEDYVQGCASKSDMERGELNKEKTGIFTGAYAINPVNEERIPIWISDYVMMGYGTGAIMAVPAHDERDYAFAEKFELPIVQVVTRSTGVPPVAQPADDPPQTPDSSKTPSIYPYYHPESEGGEMDVHERNLPHWKQDGRYYFLTWRLADSIPLSKLNEWKNERAQWFKAHPGELTPEQEVEYHQLFSARIDDWLDRGMGSCVLKNRSCAEVVAEAFKHFDGERYDLDSFVIMPNHVHLAVRVYDGEDLSQIIHSWKSFSAKEINKIRHEEGQVWQDEYFDRIIRGSGHLVRVRNYIAKNPVKAGLPEGTVIFEVGGDGGSVGTSGSSSATGETPVLLGKTERAGEKEDEGDGGVAPATGGTPVLLGKAERAGEKEGEGDGGVAPATGGTPVLLGKTERVGEKEGEGEGGVAPATGGTPVLLGSPVLLEGYAIHSGFLDGLPTAEAKVKMIDWLEENGKGSRQINYKLRDWLFSRQRYWGEPFPLIWNRETDEHAAISEAELPLLQPEMEDFKPTGDPRGPLVKARDWIHYSDQWERETNTMPQWAGSCWYYLRYCDPGNSERFVSREAEAYWSGQTDESTPKALVDLYVGGTEHAVLHLLYARFWHKVLYDLGHVSTPEPFQKLVNQGLILGEDGRKMSKSFGNVVNPDDVVSEYGADALRLYEMFMGPLTEVKPWQMKGVEGVSRFLARVWRVAMEVNQAGEWEVSDKVRDIPCDDSSLLKVVHETVKKVTEDIERMSFNTAISQMMVCTNAFTSAEVVPKREFMLLLHMLNPFAPHLTEELNKLLGGETLLADQAWPEHDESALIETEIELVVQVNGKLRDKIMVAKDAEKEAVESAAQEAPKVVEHLEGKTIRKVIVVPGRLVNIVAN